MLNKISNLKYYAKTIMNDNDDDYMFILLILQNKLNKVYDHWGKHTTYQNDYTDKDKLKTLLEELNNLIINHEEYQKSDDLKKEYSKKLERFFCKLGRSIDRFWN